MENHDDYFKRIRSERSGFKKNLANLSSAVSNFLSAIDMVMETEESRERGKKIAHLCNKLDVCNDAAMRFGLEYSFKKINKMKDKINEGNKQRGVK
jgi:predicted MarR family transcription regulator